ncbi:cytochrome b5-like heme/steroid binding domain-containing protein [Lipomyces oligophaga]|uniref:cytochrome b5-like heme/steroid binding domain-containing protein n=1 Tax=Lipomyces oligophaga TaxID=45792 RepID=UPI0034CF7750
MTFSISSVNPSYFPVIDAALIFASAFVVYRTIFPSTSPPRKHLEAAEFAGKAPEAIIFTTFTPGSLVPFNGEDDERVLLAIRGNVFDVTSGKSFYGPNGPYSNFAGRDASRGLAKGSFDDDMLTPVDQPLDALNDLTPEEINALNDWEAHFRGKYIHCGTLVQEL